MGFTPGAAGYTNSGIALARRRWMALDTPALMSRIAALKGAVGTGKARLNHVHARSKIRDSSLSYLRVLDVPFIPQISSKIQPNTLALLKPRWCGWQLETAQAGAMSKALTKAGTMDKKRLEQFKKKLEERQQELRRVVSRTEQDGRDADSEVAQDIADKAANSYNKEFLFHQSNSERQILQMVESALDRIRQGTFGQCISCGEDINTKRLEAVPWTRYCIACQEKLEKGQLVEETE